MNERCAAALRLAIIVGACCATYPAPAQWLDLDVPAPPILREGSEFEAIAARLEAEARELDARSSTPAEAVCASARAAFRRTAAALLRAGASRQGVGGDAPIAGGQRIVSAMPALDALALASIDETTPAELRAAITVRLRAFAQNANRFDASSVPDGPTLDVSLAFLFGELAEVESLLTGRSDRGAWPLDPRVRPGPTPAELRERIQQAGWSAETLQALAPMLDALERASSSLVMAPAAEDAGVLLERAALAARALADSGWLGEADSAALMQRIESGVRQLPDPAQRREARAGLEGATLFAEAAASAQRAAMAGGEERALRELLTAAAIRLAPGSLDDDDRRVAGALRGYLERVEWSRPRLRRDGWSRDETKPAWGALVPVVRAAEESAATELMAALRDPNAMQRPSVISAIAHHREMVEALRRLERVTGLLAALAARGDAAAGAASQGVRTLVKAHLDGAQQSWAVRQLARFEEQWTRFGEPLALRPDDPEPFRALAQRLQNEWLSAWGDGEPADEAERLGPVVRTLRLRADAALVADAADDAPGAVWAGLSGAREALREEALRCLDAVDAEVRGLATARDDAARWAIVRAAASIERALSRSWLDAPPSASVAGLAAPPSARSWLIPERDRLAALARWSIELSAAERRGESGRAEDIRAFLAPAAEGLAEAVEESERPAMLAP